MKVRIKKIGMSLLEGILKRKKLVLALSCLVVFITTYVLILPAFTLDKDEAAAQGGIDVPASVNTEETEPDPDPDAEEMKEETAETEVSGQEDEAAGEAEGTAGAPLIYKGKGYTITVDPGEDSWLPEGTVLEVSETGQDTKEYGKLLMQTWQEVNKDFIEVEKQRLTYNESMGFLPETEMVNLDDARFFDMRFVKDGKTVKPAGPVKVSITYDKDPAAGEGQVSGMVCFDKKGAEIIDDTGFSYDG